MTTTHALDRRLTSTDYRMAHLALLAKAEECLSLTLKARRRGGRGIEFAVYDYAAMALRFLAAEGIVSHG